MLGPSNQDFILPCVQPGENFNQRRVINTDKLLMIGWQVLWNLSRVSEILIYLGYSGSDFRICVLNLPRKHQGHQNKLIKEARSRRNQNVVLLCVQIEDNLNPKDV